jgi:acetyl/propionyl-CoA carboxylase alpha subunit
MFSKGKKCSGLKYLRFSHNRIDKILIANRGEIACRVIKTAKKMGIKTVAVYSDADENALFTKLADEAYHIGPSPSSDSYLRGDKILSIALESGAHAIHPGYKSNSLNKNLLDMYYYFVLKLLGMVSYQKIQAFLNKWMKKD